MSSRCIARESPRSSPFGGSTWRSPTANSSRCEVLRLWEDDPPEPARRNRPANGGTNRSERIEPGRPQRCRARSVSLAEGRFHLPVLQPRPHADRGGERRVADALGGERAVGPLQAYEGIA